MKMSYNIKGVVKKDIHSSVGNAHTTNTTRNKKENIG